MSCEDLGCELESAVCLRLSLYAQVRRDQSRVVDEGQSFCAQLIEYVADRSAGECARPFGGMSRTRYSNYPWDAGKQAERDQSARRYKRAWNANTYSVSEMIHARNALHKSCDTKCAPRACWAMPNTRPSSRPAARPIIASLRLRS